MLIPSDNLVEQRIKDKNKQTEKNKSMGSEENSEDIEQSKSKLSFFTPQYNFYQHYLQTCVSFD